MPGSEIPADLGTKVLSFEKFKFLEAAMGMFLGDEQKDDGSEKKKKENGGGEKMEATKTALKAIILFAKLAQAKAEEENMVQLWTEAVPIQFFAEPTSGWPFYIILIMVFSFDVMFGAVMAWFMIYPYFHRVTLVSSNVVPRPTFLVHALPREERTQSSTSTSAPLPQVSQPRSDGPTSSSSGAAGRSSSAAAAGAAGPNDAGTSSSSTAAAESASLGSGIRQRHDGARSRTHPLFVSQMGARYHCDTECCGLRKARMVQMCPR